MINGTVVGIVLDNVDPTGLHRVKVRFPVDSGVDSSWCRIATPMAGRDRGLVMLPDIGTEVILSYATRSLSPYVIGAVYNGGDDKPEPYHNDDGHDDRRVFWSRNDHMLIFDDTPGGERVAIGAKAEARLQVDSAPVHHIFDAAGRKVIERSDGSTYYTADRTVSFKCANLTIKARRMLAQGGSAAVIQSAGSMSIKAGSIIRVTSPDTQVKTSASPPCAVTASPARPPIHPPRRT